ncbi:MAG: bifunctional oligoribonuclease/PAP phosphatase NrnA [Crocinitomicaceae bacterium]|nr:bifunctional oligoribonuclease/PAP phosphatase NrnA [Crocinitomicaceae bacterium]
MIITKEKIDQLQSWVEEANHIVITAHKSPDGDSVGSSLGLFHYLKKKSDKVFICHPDEAPDFLHWLPGYDHILNLDQHQKDVEENLSKADLIFCLDYNSPGRIGKMEKILTASDAKKILIDHHRDPDMEFCELMFSDITACSTSQLICEIIDASGDDHLIDETLGTPLYAGIITDTGSFRFSSTLPKTHHIAANLMEHGVRHYKVHENIYDTNSLDKIRLSSYALLEKLEVLEQYETAFISLSQEELKRFSAQKGDTEGLVNQVLAIEGVKMAVFMKEVEGIVKMSFRSKDNIPVNELASNHFSGGGHLNASGGKYVGGIDDAVKKFVTILPTFVEEHKAQFNEV